MKNLTMEEQNQLLPPGIILLGYRGSIAHGTYLNPEHVEDSIDDKDVMGVAIPTIDHYFGIGEGSMRRGTYERKVKEWDAVTYELRKYVTLLCQANPNVMSLLWLEKHHYINVREEGRILIDSRHLFATKQAYYSFVGYAHGQMKRMTSYAKKGYMGQKRKELVEKFGYDTKNASHLIRLLRMGIEFLREGELHVHRHDARELVAIKMGEWSLDRVKEEANRLFKRAEDAYDTCSLPNRPDQEKINRLCVDILINHFANGRIYV